MVAAGIVLRWLRLLLLVFAVPFSIPLRLLMISLEGMASLIDKIGAAIFKPIDGLRRKRHSLIRQSHAILPVAEIQARIGRKG